LRIIGGLERWQSNGQYVRIPEGSIYERSVSSVTFEENDMATVIECVVDDTELVSAATGEIVDSELATLWITTSLVRFPDGWRLTTTNTSERIDGRAACDE
jgi:hypothetical protein